MNDPVMTAPHEPVGRYVLQPAFARGGMASVHLARLFGAEGFSRLVAAKRLHPQFADDPDFVEMFLDEARIASKIHHPNVVPVLDVVLAGSEVILVQEYVHGVPLSQLFRVALSDDAPIPVPIVVGVVTGVLAGLHAAHEAKDERGMSLDVVHRDVSPQNVIVSVDGVPRLLDFGIAKARTSAHVTLEGFFKGKIAYMPPEQLRMERVTRKADIYAAGVLCWELLAHRRLHGRQRETEFVAAVVNGGIPALSAALAESRPRIADERWGSIVGLERIVGRALATSADDRWETAAEMAEAILAVSPAATPSDVARWVRSAGADYLAQREEAIAANDESARGTWAEASAGSGAQAAVVLPISGAHATDASGIKLAAIATATRDAAAGAVVGVGRQAAETVERDGPRSVAREELASRAREAAKVAPWIVTGACLVVVGGVLGVLGARDRELPAGPARAAGAMGAMGAIGAAGAVDPTAAPSEAAAAGSPFAPSGSPAPSADPAGGSPAASSRAIRPSPPPPPPPPPPIVFVAPARIPPPPTPRAPAAAAHPAPVTPPGAAASLPLVPPSAKVDCNPPFYFDGTKKVFKTNCI